MIDVYRIVRTRRAGFIVFLSRLKVAFWGRPLIIAIEGRAASGKTTLGNLLSEVLDAPVVHMDDFFVPLSLRSEERSKEVGGNVHYERFIEEVLPKLSKMTGFDYRFFDCTIFDYNGQKHIPKSNIVIVEGCYSTHPSFGDYADIKIFSDIDYETQKERILKRNGEEKLKHFVEEWIPKEESYLATKDVTEYIYWNSTYSKKK